MLFENIVPDVKYGWGKIHPGGLKWIEGYKVRDSGLSLANADWHGLDLFWRKHPELAKLVRRVQLRFPPIIRLVRCLDSDDVNSALDYFRGPAVDVYVGIGVRVVMGVFNQLGGKGEWVWGLESYWVGSWRVIRSLMAWNDVEGLVSSMAVSSCVIAYVLQSTAC